MKIAKNILGLVIIIILIITAVVLLTREKKQSEIVTTPDGEEVVTGLVDSGAKAEVGNLAPDFILIDFEGNPVKLSDFRGKPVFIDFWAAWCPFCVAEMSFIESLHQEFSEQAVIIGIHRTNTESFEAGKDYAENTVMVTYLLLQDRTDEIYRAYTPSFPGMPAAAWIDKDGVLVKLKIGPKTSEELRTNIEDLIAR